MGLENYSYFYALQAKCDWIHYNKMELEKFDRQLRLMVMLASSRRYTVEEVSRELSMSRRSIYRYIDAFRSMGFIVHKKGTRYNLDHESPFFLEITDRIHFSDDEAIAINQVLNAVVDNSPQVRHLREKLSSLYDFNVMAKHGVDDQVAKNLSRLYNAIQSERVVVLKNYRSANTGQVSNRIVEPYLFTAENSEVRCYEITTGMCKTFKLNRIEKVEILDVLWSHKQKHAPYYVDLFHFGGEDRHVVKLLMGTLATSILLEEYPGAETQIKLNDDGRHLLTTEVCSYKGIGRFVMGLADDIEIVGSPEFVEYIKRRTKDLTEKFLK